MTVLMQALVLAQVAQSVIDDAGANSGAGPGAVTQSCFAGAGANAGAGDGASGPKCVC